MFFGIKRHVARETYFNKEIYLLLAENMNSFCDCRMRDNVFVDLKTHRFYLAFLSVDNCFFLSFWWRLCLFRSRVISANDTWHQFFCGYFHKFYFILLTLNFIATFFPDRSVHVCVDNFISFFEVEFVFSAWLAYLEFSCSRVPFMIGIGECEGFLCLYVYRDGERASKQSQAFTLANCNTVWTSLMKSRHGEYLEINITGNCTDKQI